jgi:flagellar hook-length control protein FliK
MNVVTITQTMPDQITIAPLGQQGEASPFADILDSFVDSTSAVEPDQTLDADQVIEQLMACLLQLLPANGTSASDSVPANGTPASNGAPTNGTPASDGVQNSGATGMAGVLQLPQQASPNEGTAIVTTNVETVKHVEQMPPRAIAGVHISLLPAITQQAVEQMPPRAIAGVHISLLPAITQQAGGAETSQPVAMQQASDAGKMQPAASSPALAPENFPQVPEQSDNEPQHWQYESEKTQAALPQSAQSDGIYFAAQDSKTPTPQLPTQGTPAAAAPSHDELFASRPYLLAQIMQQEQRAVIHIERPGTRLEVSVKLKGHALEAQFVTAEAATAQLLHRHADELRQMLQQQGVEVAQMAFACTTQTPTSDAGHSSKSLLPQQFTGYREEEESAKTIVAQTTQPRMWIVHGDGKVSYYA